MLRPHAAPLDVSSETLKDVAGHHQLQFRVHRESQLCTVPDDWAQGFGASEQLSEGCKVNVSSRCCL